MFVSIKVESGLLSLVLLLSLASYAMAEDVVGDIAVDIEMPESDQPIKTLVGADIMPGTEAPALSVSEFQVPDGVSGVAVQAVEVQISTTGVAESSTVPELTTLVFTNPPEPIAAEEDENVVLVKKADELDQAPPQSISEDSTAVHSEPDSTLLQYQTVPLDSVQLDQTTTTADIDEEVIKVSANAQKAVIGLIIPRDFSMTTTAVAIEQPDELSEAIQTDPVTSTTSVTTTKLLIKPSIATNSSNQTMGRRVAAAAIRASKKYTSNAGVKPSSGLALAWIAAIVSAIKLNLK